MDAPGHFMTREYASYGAAVTITPPGTMNQAAQPTTALVDYAKATCPRTATAVNPFSTDREAHGTHRHSVSGGGSADAAWLRRTGRSRVPT
jgi:hypothetical protein